MLSSALLSRASLSPRLDAGNNGRPTVLAILQVIELVGQMLPGKFAVLIAGSRFLALDDNTRGNVL